MVSPSILGRQVARSSSNFSQRSFSSSRAVAADVKKLGVIGAGQMVRSDGLGQCSRPLIVVSRDLVLPLLLRRKQTCLFV
jgi:hypothetical protein